MVKRHFLCVGLLLLAAGQPNRAEDSARAFLTTSFQVTSAEVERINAGHVVVRTLGATDPREVATTGRRAHPRDAGVLRRATCRYRHFQAH